MTTLTAASRCDRCGARATVTVVYDLLLCDHHAREYGFLDSLPRTIAATSGPAGE